MTNTKAQQGSSSRGKRRFWKKVVKGKVDECWRWIGARDRNGYGVVSVRIAEGVYRNRPARRIAYELLMGELPDEVLLLSKCGNRQCVSPGHHFTGNRKQIPGMPSIPWRDRTALPKN